MYVVFLLAGLFLLFYYKISIKNLFKDLINRWREFVLVGSSVVISYVLFKILKILFHTDRPFIVFTQIHSLFFESGFAFPSGHATTFAALAFSIFFINKKAGYIFMVFALLIGLARIVAGVHFPIDILGGFILGAGIAYFVKFILKKFFNLQLS